MEEGLKPALNQPGTTSLHQSTQVNPASAKGDLICSGLQTDHQRRKFMIKNRKF